MFSLFCRDLRDIMGGQDKFPEIMTKNNFKQKIIGNNIKFVVLSFFLFFFYQSTEIIKICTLYKF